VSVIKTLVFAVLALLLSACQSTPSPVDYTEELSIAPDWVVNLPQSNDYIYGVGSSTIYTSESIAIESANESARLALAKTIRVEIEGSTQVERGSDNGQLSFYFNEAVVNSAPKMELAGVKIVDRFVDKNTSTIFVLATFNKTEAINVLHQMIDELDVELAMIKIDFSKPVGEKLTQAIAAKKLLLTRAGYNQQLVNLRQHKVFIAPNTSALITDIHRVLNEITFSVVGSNVGGDNVVDENNIELQSKLIEAITLQGLRVNNKKADFKISYRIKWRDLNRDNTYYSIMSASISLSVADSILRAFNKKAKGTSSDQHLARAKAIEKLANQFSVILAEELLASFEHSATEK